MNLYTRKVSRAFIYNPETKLFLLARGCLPPFNFHLPGGGINKNELPEAALRRELKEELDINPEQITSVTFINKANGWAMYLPHEMDMFLVVVHDLKLKLSWEVFGIKWVTFDELKKYVNHDCLTEISTVKNLIQN